MYNINKKGFTLVELLAVIVILAIILAIAIPSISNMIASSTKASFESDAKLILKAASLKTLEDGTFDPTTVNETNIETLLNVDDSKYQTLTIKKVNGELYVTIIGKDKWNNLTASGTKKQLSVSNTISVNYVRGANAPVLAAGMTPIKWNGSAWVTTTETDTAWYNYDTTNKIWANAQTADGSMWVWIPRYIYKIPTANWHTSTAGSISIQFTKGVDDNWNKASIGAIDLGETANASNNKWTNHPAFTFGDAELTGIWVAKFEASGTTSALDFKPNVTSLRSQPIETFFTAARNMEANTRYGWGTTGDGIDTHMMKNTEWGAVTYLAQSTYGKNTEVWINNSNTYITGCAGDSVSDAASTTGCEYVYNTTNGLQASTTGNIYGIYDMSGGAWEYTPDYVDNGNTNLNNGDIILSADAKYKEIYTKSPTDSDINNYALVISHKGIAVYETSATGSTATSWNADYSYMARTDQPWFIRGGYFSSGAGAGMFHFHCYTGATASSIGFRSSLLVGAGL